MALLSPILEKLLGSAEYSAERIREELKFVPQESFLTALPEIIAAYRSKK